MPIILSNIKKTVLFSLALCSVTGGVAFFVQSRAGKSVSACSYLDPLIIDILALGVGFFLVVEAMADIATHQGIMFKNQIIKSVRMSIGVSILVIHIMQFLHK